jgi:DNA modification methylase
MHITYIDNGMVRGRIGFNNFMLCLIFSKGNAKLRNITKDVYKCSTSSKQRNKIKHPTPKKIGAIRQLIKGFSNENELVFDPFMGSGSTAIACKELNRKYIGFEIDIEYYKIIKDRLMQERLIS